MRESSGMVRIRFLVSTPQIWIRGHTQGSHFKFLGDSDSPGLESPWPEWPRNQPCAPGPHKKKRGGIPRVAWRVEDPVLSLQWLGFWSLSQELLHAWGMRPCPPKRGQMARAAQSIGQSQAGGGTVLTQPLARVTSVFLSEK